jgi:hypothetical protein
VQAKTRAGLERLVARQDTSALRLRWVLLISDAHERTPRRAALNRVAEFYEHELGLLLERVPGSFDRIDAGTRDACHFEDLIRRYKRSEHTP